jgi:hypothetical protein
LTNGVDVPVYAEAFPNAFKSESEVAEAKPKAMKNPLYGGKIRS